MAITSHRSFLMMTASTMLSSFALPVIAHAQSTSTILRPTLPPDYNRGRNVSVTERPRPDYDPLGVRVNSFILYPKLAVSVGVSDNVYATDDATVSDGFLTVAPSVSLRSDWSRHQLQLQGGGDFRRYFSNERVNADQWNIAGLGRVDLGSSLSITAEGQAALVQEEPFSGESDANVAVLSRYHRYLAGARALYRAGRVRITGGYNYAGIRFNSVSLAAGATLNQSDRDRDLHSVTGQLEYALSPSLVVYGLATYSDTEYLRPLLNGAANRDSREYRTIAGVNIDLSGFLRGTIGLGYMRRNYRSPLYRDVGGLASDVKLEYFYNELTTFTLTASSSIDDSSVVGLGAFKSKRVGLRADHELRRNVLLNLGADYNNQDYLQSTRQNHFYRLFGGADLLISRRARAGLNATYRFRSRRGTAFDNSVEEVRGVATVTYQL